MVFVNIIEMSRQCDTAKKKKVSFWSLSAKPILCLREADLTTALLKEFLCKSDLEILSLKM